MRKGFMEAMVTRFTARRATPAQPNTAPHTHLLQSWERERSAATYPSASSQRCRPGGCRPGHGYRHARAHGRLRP